MSEREEKRPVGKTGKKAYAISESADQPLRQESGRSGRCRSYRV